MRRKTRTAKNEGERSCPKITKCHTCISRDHSLFNHRSRVSISCIVTIANIEHLLVSRHCSKYVHGLSLLILTMTTEACSSSPNIYWAPTICQTLVWVRRLLHWSKHREVPALCNLYSRAARSSTARIWIQEVWLLGCKGIIPMSRCHEMLPLLETSENLIDQKYLSVKQPGMFTFWFILQGCWGGVLLD